MPTIEELKSEAITLKETERVSGRLMTHGAALEQTARRHGYASWRACRAALAASTSPQKASLTEPRADSAIEMRRYTHKEWNFSLEIPDRWNSFPAVPTNSPYEVIRFASHEAGIHLLIVFRMPYDPLKSRKAYADEIQQKLADAGFENFVIGQTSIGSHAVATLDFDRLKDGAVWSCRHYFITDGTLAYTLGFGTSEREAMFGLYDRMAKSFVPHEVGPTL